MLILSAWILFVRTFRKLRAVERQLDEALKRPHHFQDDYTFDSRTGLFRHKENSGLYCGLCILKDIRSPVTESPEGWRCLGEYDHWYENPDFCPF